MNRFANSSIVLFAAVLVSFFTPHSSYTKDSIFSDQLDNVNQTMPDAGFPGLPQMSPEEMQQFEAEMAQLNQMLEGLSPEEQEKVLNEMVQEAMEEVKKDLSDEGKELLDKLNDTGDISDEDFEKLLNELAPQENSKEQPEPTKPQPISKEQPKIILTTAHQKALDLINSLIDRTNLFIVKASTIPELPGSISKWQREKKINWQPNLTWNKFKSDLDSFVSKLEQLKKQDPKTQQYNHLDELIKDETLYNNLSKVEKVAVQYEPLVEEIAPIGGQTVPEESKNAIQKLLTQYNEALYILNLGQAIDELFGKFEPKAKEMRKAEQEAKIAAEQEAKKTRRSGAPVTGGIAQKDYNQSFDFDDNFDDYYPEFQDSASQEAFIPSYEPPRQDSFLPSSREFQKGATPTKDNDSIKPTREKEEESMSQGQKSSAWPSSSKKKSSTETAKKAEKAQDFLKQVAEFISTNKTLSSDLEKEVQGPSYNEQTIKEDLPNLEGLLRNAQRLMNEFYASIQNKPTNIKNRLIKDLKTSTNKSARTIQEFVARLAKIESRINSLTPIKQYLYFGIINPSFAQDKQMETIQSDYPRPISLSSIKAQAEALLGIESTMKSTPVSPESKTPTPERPAPKERFEAQNNGAAFSPSKDKNYLQPIANYIRDNNLIDLIKAEISTHNKFNKEIVETFLPTLNQLLAQAEQIKKQFGYVNNTDTKVIQNLADTISSPKIDVESLPIDKQYLYFGINNPLIEKELNQILDKPLADKFLAALKAQTSDWLQATSDFNTRNNIDKWTATRLINFTYDAINQSELLEKIQDKYPNPINLNTIKERIANILQAK